MSTRHGNETAPAGLYLDLRHLALVSLDEPGLLPGSRENRYRSLPAPVLLIAGPLLGGLYVVFLPVLGFVILARAAGGKLAELIGRGRGTSVPLKKA